MSKREKIRVAMYVAFIFGILMLNPTVRGIVAFLLPLGSGVDDLVAFGLMIVGALLYFIHNALAARPGWDGNRSRFWGIIGVSAVLVFAAILGLWILG